MYLKAKSYKLVFKYDLINTLKFIHNNTIKVRGKTGKDFEKLAMIASKNNSLNVLKYLITKMDLDVSFDEEHILKDALFYDYRDMAKLVIKHGADIQKCTSSLADACLIGNADLVQFIFDSGYKGNARENECVVYACENGHLHILKMLLDNGMCVSDILFEMLEQYSTKECYEYLREYLYVV